MIYEMLLDTPKFSYKWYKLLMELMHANKTNKTERQIQIDFSEKTFICDGKVLHLSKLNPLSAGIAQIDFGTTERIDKYNAFVFETDIMFDFADDENFLSNYFYLRLGTSRETFGYYLAFSPSRASTHLS